MCEKDTKHNTPVLVISGDVILTTSFKEIVRVISIFLSI